MAIIIITIIGYWYVRNGKSGESILSTQVAYNPLGGTDEAIDNIGRDRCTELEMVTSSHERFSSS